MTPLTQLAAVIDAQQTAVHAQREQRQAGVQTKTALLRGLGTQLTFPVRLTLPAGVEVHTGERKGEWAQVALADGVQGWAPSDALLALPFGG